MSESETQFLERLREEAERGLGPGIAVRQVTTTDAGRRTRLRVDCDTPVGPRIFEADGGTLIEAAGRLLARLPEERLAVAFLRVVDGTPARR
jgi:hypothetical protein